MISNVKQKVFHPLLSVSAAHNWRTFQVHSLFCARNSKNTIFTHHFLFWVFQLPQYASVPGWDTTWWNARSPEQTAGGSQISEDRYMMDAHIKDSVFHRHLADFYNLSQVSNRWSSLHGPDEYIFGGGLQMLSGKAELEGRVTEGEAARRRRLGELSCPD